ncbi:sugar transferase [Hymenobacter sp. ASUV-10]|uniref:Sugar transferase n=1 Tax=Hymenobacter aranciens TaxID=3063996 RepID=A0ABT9B8S0_9BACT|nr:sugar transferase [Hymenobacter sp. ASUV-10]MDO7874058.1 sugar transferase [Hymenobacter sp. ASUV-10]
MYERTKRLFDFTAAALGLLLLAPVLLTTAVVAWLGGLRPVLFRQRRAGRHGRLFDIVKFRSMTQQRDAAGQLLPDEQRLTTLGRSLRRSSLDELPQLWNVLRGELSLIGPRPLLPEYLPLYSPAQAVRHEVRPGITGWAQVHGRNALSWEEKFRLDAWYVAHRGWALDLRILWLTLRHVLAREQPAGAYAPAERFVGSAEIEQVKK